MVAELIGRSPPNHSERRCRRTRLVRIMTPRHRETFVCTACGLIAAEPIDGQMSV
jgi:hypothetical protein